MLYALSGANGGLPKEAAVVMGILIRLEGMQEGKNMVTDSYESKEGYAEDHVKGCALGKWRYHFTGKVWKWRGWSYRYGLMAYGVHW